MTLACAPADAWTGDSSIDGGGTGTGVGLAVGVDVPVGRGAGDGAGAKVGAGVGVGAGAGDGVESGSSGTFKAIRVTTFRTELNAVMLYGGRA